MPYGRKFRRSIRRPFRRQVRRRTSWRSARRQRYSGAHPRRSPHITKMGVSRPISILPDAIRVKCKWVGEYNFGGGLTNYITVTGNNVNNVGTGSRAAGLLLWSNYYNLFRVDSSSINIQFIPYKDAGTAGQVGQMSASASNCQCVIVPFSDASPSTYFGNIDAFTAKMQPYSRSCIMTPYRPSHMRNYITTDKLFGRGCKELAFGSPTISGSPTQVWYWYVGITAFDSLAYSWARAIITVQYYTTFYQRISEAY